MREIVLSHRESARCMQACAPVSSRSEERCKATAQGPWVKIATTVLWLDAVVTSVDARASGTAADALGRLQRCSTSQIGQATTRSTRSTPPMNPYQLSHCHHLRWPRSRVAAPWSLARMMRPTLRDRLPRVMTVTAPRQPARPFRSQTGPAYTILSPPRPTSKLSWLSPLPSSCRPCQGCENRTHRCLLLSLIHI